LLFVFSKINLLAAACCLLLALHHLGKGLRASCWRSLKSCEQRARPSVSGPTDGELWSSLASPQSSGRLPASSPRMFLALLYLTVSESKQFNTHLGKPFQLS
jgi:hypothetical protein